MDIKIEKPHEIHAGMSRHGLKTQQPTHMKYQHHFEDLGFSFQTSHVEVTYQSVTFLLNLGMLNQIFLDHFNGTHAQ